jgi:hypothetical protein
LIVPLFAFVIPGEGALAPQTRNEAARASANLSRMHALKNVAFATLRRRLVPGLAALRPE